MDTAAKKQAFRQQRRNAFTRGIGWELTFEEWSDWWGQDIDKRGVSQTSLQMCRFADKGPYRLDNIYKGTPKQNAKTKYCVYYNNKSAAAHKAHQEALDNAEVVGAGEEEDWINPEEMTVSEYYEYKASKSRAPASDYKRLVGSRVCG